MCVSWSMLAAAAAAGDDDVNEYCGSFGGNEMEEKKNCEINEIHIKEWKATIVKFEIIFCCLKVAR